MGTTLWILSIWFLLNAAFVAIRIYVTRANRFEGWAWRADLEQAMAIRNEPYPGARSAPRGNRPWSDPDLASGRRQSAGAANQFETAMAALAWLKSANASRYIEIDERGEIICSEMRFSHLA